MMEPRKKIILSSIILGLSVLVFVFLIIYPLFREIKRKSEEVGFQKRILIENQIKIDSLEEIQALYKTYSQNLEKIDALLVDAETPVDFIKFLEKTAEDFEISIEILPNAFQSAEAGVWSSLNFQICLFGSFLNCSRFLEKLELSSFPTASEDKPYTFDSKMWGKGFLIEILNLNARNTDEQNIKAVLLVKVYVK